MIKISTRLIQLLPFIKMGGRPGARNKVTIAHGGFF